MFRGKLKLFPPCGLSFDTEPAVRIQPSFLMQCDAKPERLTVGACHVYGFPDRVLRSLRITEVPEGHRDITSVHDAGVVMRQGRPGAGSLPILELVYSFRAGLVSAGKI